MTVKKTIQREATKPSLKSLEPKLDVDFHKQRVEAILRRHESLDSARELLGYDIVAATSDGVKRVRISKTRSFNGISGRTTNREGIEQDAGMIYIMKFRSTKFLNITTGRAGNPTCVWIEEAIDVDTGEKLKSNKLLRHLELEGSDRQPIFSDRTAIVAGETPSKIERLNPAKNGASENTTGVFQAHF
ncbi:hypothetical protein KKB44_06225 [Candidatus Micrarchaeota archaeon]|nr:hypothetical protein [Candidatus Micrarchaeota archaeon]